MTKNNESVFSEINRNILIKKTYVLFIWITKLKRQS